MSFAVVTGASSGIGRATAILLGRRGFSVGLLARAGQGLSEVQREVERSGGSAVAIPCDLRLELDIQVASQRVLEVAVPDAVIHNAGVVRRGQIEDTSAEVWDDQLSVNLRAPFLLTRELLPAMRQRGRGRFVTVSSISGTLGSAGAAAYCASKWGLIGFTKSLAEELSNTGLMAVCLLPGSVDTRMLRGSGFPPRMSPEDVAQTIVHYAVDAPVAHNGATIEMFGT